MSCCALGHVSIANSKRMVVKAAADLVTALALLTLLRHLFDSLTHPSRDWARVCSRAGSAFLEGYIFASHICIVGDWLQVMGLYYT